MNLSLTLFTSSLTLAWLGAVPFAAAYPINNPPQQILSFGDSLSDTGNLYQFTQQQVPPSPPYAEGRLSNGALWVEMLAQRFNLTPVRITSLPPTVSTLPPGGVNFAFGGATTGTVTLPGGIIFPGLPQQVGTFLTRFSRPTSNSKALYTVWFGGNDYRAAATPQPPWIAFQTVARVVGNISLGLEALIQSGATQILVFNLPDIGKTPFARTVNPTYLSTLVRAHNIWLSHTVSVLNAKYPNAKIQLVDTYTLTNRMIRNTAAFGLTNVTDSCLNLISFIPCSNPDQYLFWDDFHPTRMGHQMIAQAVFRLLRNPTNSSVANLSESTQLTLAN